MSKAEKYLTGIFNLKFAFVLIITNPDKSIGFKHNIVCIIFTIVRFKRNQVHDQPKQIIDKNPHEFQNDVISWQIMSPPYSVRILTNKQLYKKHI